MNHDKAYERVADRYLESALENARAGLHEVCTFAAYHAFESIGGALTVHSGSVYPRSPHAKKLNAFVRVASSLGLCLPIARFAILVASYRNPSLYPTRIGLGGFDPPDCLTTAGESARILTRVRSIVRHVKRLL
jgi:hypothetical protein